jgi:hypothetical protein
LLRIFYKMNIERDLPDKKYSGIAENKPDE